MQDIGKANLRKVAVIGCGFVGSASAFALMQSGLFSEMVLIDADTDKAQGEALDISHGVPLARPINIYGGNYDDIVDAAIIIITAGANQKPGETRLDLVKKNVNIYKSIIPEIASRNCHGTILVVSNPVDILTYTALKISGFPKNRVIGSGTVLDTSRLKHELGKHLSVDSKVSMHLSLENMVTARSQLSAVQMYPVFRLMSSVSCVAFTTMKNQPEKLPKKSRTVLMRSLKRSMQLIMELLWQSKEYVKRS